MPVYGCTFGWVANIVVDRDLDRITPIGFEERLSVRQQ